MDPLRNPYFPGAGTPPLPPELAGRDELLEKVSIAPAPNQDWYCRQRLFSLFIWCPLRSLGVFAFVFLLTSVFSVLIFFGYLTARRVYCRLMAQTRRAFVLSLPG